MGTHRLSTRIAAPPERVFDLWLDLDRAPEWIEGLTKITDRTGPLTERGSSYLAWFGGMASKVTVLDVERPRRYVSRLHSRMLRGTNEATFTPEGGGTRIDQVFRTQGVIPAIAGWIFSKGSWKGSFKGELETFRQIAEREAAAAG